jgi:hypothetical protein
VGKLESIKEVLAVDEKARAAARDQIGAWTRDPKTPAGAGLRDN